MYLAQRGRPTAGCVYRARWAGAGGLDLCDYTRSLPVQSFLRLTINDPFVLGRCSRRGTTKAAVSGHEASWSDYVKDYVLELKSFLYLNWQWLVSNKLIYLNIIRGIMKVTVINRLFKYTEKCH